MSKLAIGLIVSAALSGLVPRPTAPPPGSAQAAWVDPLAGSYEPRPQPPDAPLDQVSITLQRGYCYGTCPAYQAEIRGDGTAVYRGEGYVLINGEHHDRVSPVAVKCLLDFLNAAGFWGLQGQYDYPISDGPSVRVTLSVGSAQKTVRDYYGERAGMPHAVKRVEDAIDRLVGDRWAQGDSQTVERLVGEGYRFRSTAGATLLATAAGLSPEDVSLDILRQGAPARGLSSSTGWGSRQSAVVAAAGDGKLRLVRALIAAGAFAGPNGGRQKVLALTSAVAFGDPQTVAVILAQRPDIKAASRGPGAVLTNVGDYSPSSIDPAVKLDIIRRLLAAGADPRQVDEAGNTALHVASSLAEVRLLLGAGARVDPVNTYGDTPLMWARSDDIAMALIEAGADYRRVSPDGDSIAKQAAEAGFPRTLAFLRSKGVAIPRIEPKAPSEPPDFLKPLPPQDDSPLCLV